jgi:hypothetical protein
VSLFTRRHYIFLTYVAKRMRRAGIDNTAVEILADALASESVGFDKDLFLQNVNETKTQTYKSSIPSTLT